MLCWLVRLQTSILAHRWIQIRKDTKTGQITHAVSCITAHSKTDVDVPCTSDGQISNQITMTNDTSFNTNGSKYFHTLTGTTCAIQVYAPTAEASLQQTDKFYNRLQQ